MSAHVDIAVVGSGAAGIAAAINAARAGKRTVLFEGHSEMGGTGGRSGITTLCGLYGDDGRYLNDGFSREFAEALNPGGPRKMGKVWVLPYEPEQFRAVSARLLASIPHLEARRSEPVADVVVKGNRIARLNGCSVGAVVDCSGTAAVARAAGVDCLATDESTQAPAIVVPLRNVDRALNTPFEVASVLLPLARAGLPPVSFQPGLEPKTVTVKFTGRVDQVRPIIELLRGLKGFEDCETSRGEFAPIQRAGRMVLGEYLLTSADVLGGRKFSDAAARCAWPIEQWDLSGTAQVTYLPAGSHYEIPARSLRAAQMENLFMGGKTISADVGAIASARVMGCCLATGAAAGQLAARYLQSDPNP